MPESRIISITAQGSLIKASSRTPVLSPLHKNKRSTATPRGIVNGLSRASRKRLLEFVATIDWPDPTIFITLTYGPAYPTPAKSKQNMRSFLERIRRRHPESAGIWRLEFQARGAPHFHVVMSNLPFIDKREIQSMWGEIISYDNPFTRIESVKSDRVLKYLAKYVAKRDGQGEGTACGYAPYDKPTEESQLPPTGRVWGVFNSPQLPYADSETCAHVHGEWYHKVKENASEHYDKIDTESSDGFTLFVDDALDWLDGQQLP